jgi:hypothetical protein
MTDNRDRVSVKFAAAKPPVTDLIPETEKGGSPKARRKERRSASFLCHPPRQAAVFHQPFDVSNHLSPSARRFTGQPAGVSNLSAFKVVALIFDSLCFNSR